MPGPISRRNFMTHVGVASAMAGSALVSARTRASDDELCPWPEGDDDDFVFDSTDPGEMPDPKRILRQGRGWKVLPTGEDDHDNLEWALRNTAAGGTVRMVRGTYKVGRPIVVPDFDGRLVGAGAARTEVTCTDELNWELYEKAKRKGKNPCKPRPFPRVSVDGSNTLTPPVVFLFYKTPRRTGERAADRANRIEIRNFRCRGSMKGTEWMFGDETIFINIVNTLDWLRPNLAPETTRQDVVVSGIEVSGYQTPEFGPFENTCGCISVLGGLVLTSDYNLQGDVDGDAAGLRNGGLLDVTPAEGDIKITSCNFESCRFCITVLGAKDSEIKLTNNHTDGGRANCLQVLDVSGCRVVFRDNDVDCDAFLFPDPLTGELTIPSSLGCIVALQGLAAAVGYPFNVQWAALAFNPEAREGLPQAGPLGTWRPQGPTVAPAPSLIRVVDNACDSSKVINTYCIHLVDAAKPAFGLETVTAVVRDNTCNDSQTCVSLEHMDSARVVHNDCDSQAYGVELHNSPNARVAGNHFSFPEGTDPCEIRVLELGDKIDLSRVRVIEGSDPEIEAGSCVDQ